MPPSRAMAMASRASVTVSMAADTSGMFNSRLRLTRVLREASRGRTRECAGRRRTSSKVSAFWITRMFSARKATLYARRPCPPPARFLWIDGKRPVNFQAIAVAKLRIERTRFSEHATLLARKIDLGVAHKHAGSHDCVAHRCAGGKLERNGICAIAYRINHLNAQRGHRAH